MKEENRWIARNGDAYTAAVVGAGSWGTAFARHLARAGLNTTLLARRQEQAEAMASDHRNPDYLRNIILPEPLKIDLLEKFSFAQVDLIVLAIPSKFYLKTVQGLVSRLPDGIGILSLTKGVEPGSLMRLSQVLTVSLKGLSPRIAVLSGPNHAEEVATDQPTATVIAAEDDAYALDLQKVLSTETFRAYVNRDLIGVEIASAVKNIIAIATGLSDGLGYGDNARAALMTRGIAEMARLGETLGAQILTFAGLAGMGDLIATCTSRHGRNRRAGELIALGHSASQVEKEMGMVAEGLTTAPAILRLAQEKGVSLPITSNVVSVAFKGKDVKLCVRELMTRGPKEEY